MRKKKPTENSIETELRNRFGAAEFVETSEPEDDTEETENILSFDLLRNAFAIHDLEENKSEETEIESVAEAELDWEEGPASEPLDKVPNEEPAVELSPRTILEAMLFVGDQENRPLCADRAAEKMRNVTPEEIDREITILNACYREQGRPYTIQREPEGYRMVLRSGFESIRDNFYGKIREAHLSQAAIDTLAVVAYRQPIAADEIQNLRQQPSSGLLSQLVRRGLLGVERKVREKKKVVLYRTTERFLDLFQLESIDDLPTAEEIDFR
jgi:segregation and condensation protein B